jgi:hypothetical protein
VALAKKFRAKDAKPDDDGAFCSTIIFPPTIDFTPIKKAVITLAKDEKFLDKKNKPIDVSDLDTWLKSKINNPFLDADQNLADITSKGEPVDLEGWTMIRPNSYRKPIVRDNRGEQLDSDDIETEAYSGRWARLMLQPKAYNRPDNKGVKFYVDSVQLLANDDNISRGGGSKGEAFGAIDDEDEDDGALD